MRYYREIYALYGIDERFIAQYALIILLVTAAIAVPIIIAWCRIFRKAGVPMGFYFIPVYGSYRQYDIADSKGVFWATLVVSILYLIGSLILVQAGETVFLVWVILYLVVMLILSFIFCKRLATAFGKSTGFAIGLFFLNPIFIMILGFGDAQYVGSAGSTSFKGLYGGGGTGSTSVWANASNSFTGGTQTVYMPAPAKPVAEPPQSREPAAEPERRLIPLHGVKSEKVQANLASARIGQTCAVRYLAREGKPNCWVVSGENGRLGVLREDEYREGQTVVLAEVRDNPEKETRYRPYVTVD